jgi:hypothetical protein
MYKSHFVCVAGVLLCCLAFSAKAQTPQDKSPSAGSVVHGSGCVEAGVEGGCIVLNDTKTGTDFNLFFKEKSPKIDTAISFEGTTNDNPNMCMQGRAVNVTKWTQIRMHCPQAAPKNAQMAQPRTKGIVETGTPGTMFSPVVRRRCTLPECAHFRRVGTRSPWLRTSRRDSTRRYICLT